MPKIDSWAFLATHPAPMKLSIGIPGVQRCGTCRPANGQPDYEFVLCGALDDILAFSQYPERPMQSGGLMNFTPGRMEWSGLTGPHAGTDEETDRAVLFLLAV